MSAFEKTKHVCLLIVGLSLLLSMPMSEATFAGFKEDSTKTRGYSERPTTGTDHAFAIYCSSPDAARLPGYKHQVWSNSIAYSIPNFLARMSDSVYTLDCDYFPSQGWYPYYEDTLYPDPGICNGGGPGFANRILEIADGDINYANYDTDSNGEVDGFFFIIIDDGGDVGGCDQVMYCNYESNDTLSNGQKVWVNGYYGVEVRIRGWESGGWHFTPMDVFTQICVHEWGHQFGLNDLYCYRPCGYCGRAIGFSAMSNESFEGRCSPYDPYSRSKLGWAESTVVWDTVTNQAIADHMSSE